MWGELISIGIVLIAYAFYKLTKNRAEHFKERNLKYRNARSIFKSHLKKLDVLQMTSETYNAFPDESIFGAYDLSVNQYIVRDPEVFKQIAVKDFDFFEDHRTVIDDKVDEVVGNIVSLMKGSQWRQMRATLSPAFTGSKMRQMFDLVSECANEIVQHFSKQAANGDRINVEMKDFFSRYTNDVIATCAFGIQVNSFENRDNEFFTSGKKLMDFSSLSQTIKLVVTFSFPRIARILNIKPFDAKSVNLFKSIILDTMATRQDKNIFRPDVINILMELREGKLKQPIEDKSKDTLDGFATVEESDVGKATVTRKWTDNELVAQCFVFFVAGFETSSMMLSFTAYELVTNPDIQQKLYEEIVEVNKKLNGKKITYDDVQKMQYLDQVVCEVLRKWPAAFQLDRHCVKDYNFDDGDKLKFKIEKNSNIIFPIYAVQHDPKYFPEPEKFDPERFNDENKHKIVSGTYAPFGLGPRNCIGSRFGLMQMKTMLYHLLLNFSFEVNEDTQIPLKLEKGMIFKIDKGVHLELKHRAK